MAGRVITMGQYMVPVVVALQLTPDLQVPKVLLIDPPWTAYWMNLTLGK